MRISLVSSRPLCLLSPKLGPSATAGVGRPLQVREPVREPRTSAPPGSGRLDTPWPRALRSRRSFLHAGLNASIGTIFLASTPVTIAACSEEALGLLAARLLNYAVSEALYKLGEAVGGRITIENPNDAEAEGYVDMELSRGETVVDGGRASYSVPPVSANEYDWSGLVAEQSGDNYTALAYSALNSVSSELFSVI